MLSGAIQHYVLKGNLRRAATQQQYLAEVYEQELGDMKQALDAYEKAAEWFEGDNAEAYVLFLSLLFLPIQQSQGKELVLTLDDAVLPTNTSSRWPIWLLWNQTTTNPSTTTSALADSPSTTT